MSGNRVLWDALFNARRWARAWKAKAANYRAMWAQAEVSEDLKRSQITKLKEALRRSFLWVTPCPTGCEGCDYCRGQKLLEKS